ncbi:hypothetical protein AJ80_01598 [Polytolypa hystricis UAMH7299]|uniref:Uncharacterized protein n=1 Tax=Polytolypa hystricis (strain UAMH7299) TaxID=1447883 RepID=A0A2B7Z0P6_POLH7|nr:hypothetical protein AJ80_01598 [Polytolypa hystricis UAMH7299]
MANSKPVEELNTFAHGTAPGSNEPQEVSQQNHACDQPAGTTNPESSFPASQPRNSNDDTSHRHPRVPANDPPMERYLQQPAREDPWSHLTREQELLEILEKVSQVNL